ncbi:hypothetical protein Angca_000151, partial [Angiostrongylus cantonensis]
HIPGHLNPADIDTTGSPITGFSHSHCWWNGSRFLTQDDDLWPNTIDMDPTSHFSPDETSHTEVDVRSTFFGMLTVSHSIPPDNDTSHVLSPLDPARFSSWARPLRAMVSVSHFINLKSNKARLHFERTKVALLNQVEIIMFRITEPLYPPS